MLVLTRKIGQSVIVDGQVKITVQRCQGQRVRLGIDAPREVPVVRKELLEPPSAGEAEGGGQDSQA